MATSITLRDAAPEDADACGAICQAAFKAIGDQHNFPAGFPSPEATARFLGSLIGHPGFYSVVAEADGRVVGSNFVDERSPVAGVGPVSVDPVFQNSSVGRQLMLHVIERSRQRGNDSMQLVQAAYHTRSLALYSKLGFAVREPLLVMQGTPLSIEIPGYHVRTAVESDAEACNRVCTRVHGHDRGTELLEAVKAGNASVVERQGYIVGYATGVGFWGHAVAETNEGMQALIGAAWSFSGKGFLLPARNNPLLKWCLDNGLRIVEPMTKMSLGPYQDPSGAFLPSVVY